MLVLLAYAPDGVRRFPISVGAMTVGSQPECEICLPYTGVAQRHARLTYDGTTLRIEDLGSRKGVLKDGARVREAALDPLDEVKVGNVTLLVEDVTGGEPQGDLLAEEAAAIGPPRITAERMLQHLARISEWVLADNESRTTSESLVSEVLSDFGGGVLFLMVGEVQAEGVKLVVASDPGWLGRGEELLDQVREHRSDYDLEVSGSLSGELSAAPAWICYHGFSALDRSYTLVIALPAFQPDEWSPVAALRTLGHLLVFGLVHHVGWYEPILPGQPMQQDLTLDPALILGESQAMKRVVEQMRHALGVGSVLLRGEAGVGKEMFARSLHLSSARRHGPFVVATCIGARPQQLEAELFGGEVAGKGGPVRREGKLLLAHGGTLFLDDVEHMPLELQARLVRCLRNGEVEPTGSTVAYPVEVRILAGSREALEEAVGRDAFRVDLAYQLSRFVIEVPPLRERREDLPLLIQSFINRFSHEAGKRMQGITVKAMSALLNYDYPGNLAELENIVQNLYYNSIPGRPAEVSALPEKVRQGAGTSGVHIDHSSDLNLERLIGAFEQAAIREALRRAHGNKSQAARLLGLSRNGLAIKIERHGLKV